MNHDEIRAVRGLLSQKAFAELLGVTPLTVLRWELAEDNKEARRPRSKMIERLRQLAAEGVGARERASGAAAETDDDDDVSEPIFRVSANAKAGKAMPATSDPALARDEHRVLPLLDRLGTETWARTEDELLGLLASETLETAAGRALASIGCAQVQLIGRLDGRSTYATLAPILRSVDRGELPDSVAARAHVIAAFLFSLLDSRFFDPGRVNAHAARAEELLGEDLVDLRILLVRARVAATRFLDPAIGLRIYRDAAGILDCATSPLARFVADGLRGYAAHVTGDSEGARRSAELDLSVAERLGLHGMMVVLIADRVHRMVRGAYLPEAILERTRMGRYAAEAGRVTMSEAYLVVLAAEIEALYRARRLKEALATAEEAMRIGQAAGVARYCLAIPVAKTYILASRGAELRNLADVLESENAGTHRGLANVHALAVRAMATCLEGNIAEAVELGDRVRTAPEGTIGIQYVIHNAHCEIVYAKLLARDADGAKIAIERGEALLKKVPSVSFSAWMMRLWGHLNLQQARFAEARQKYEAAAATFAITGDLVHEGISRDFLNALSHASSQADIGQVSVHLRALFSSWDAAPEQRQRILSLCTPSADGELHEPSLTERLAVAVDRLSVPGLRPDDLTRELASILSWVYPGRETIVGHDVAIGPGDESFDLRTEAGGLRIGVRGKLDAEERAGLRLLAAVTPLALRGSRGAIERELAVDDIAPSFLAVAPATRRLKSEVAQLSRTSSTVLILGESGSGKEVVARAVHELSSRADRPYVVFNCASVPRELFESQLFGHRRGSFTGATSDSLGVIRAADGGTLFLDEVGELPLDMQPKLLRFLENGEVLPVGEQTARRVDVRIIAATHRDLARHVRDGVFREDLFYRLNVLPLRVPPLRERSEDILALTRFFMARMTPQGATLPELASDALAALRAYTWPGNVRELRNMVERAMAYTPFPTVFHAEHLRIGG